MRIHLCQIANGLREYRSRLQQVDPRVWSGRCDRLMPHNPRSWPGKHSWYIPAPRPLERIAAQGGRRYLLGTTSACPMATQLAAALSPYYLLWPIRAAIGGVPPSAARRPTQLRQSRYPWWSNVPIAPSPEVGQQSLRHARVYADVKAMSSDPLTVAGVYVPTACTSQCRLSAGEGCHNPDRQVGAAPQSPGV